MATRLSLLNGATRPDSSGNVYPQPLDQLATNDVWDFLVFVFADTSTRVGLHGRFKVPQNYSSGANLVVTWTANATTGDVEWDFDYRAVGGNDTESLDQTGTQESVNANDTAPSAVFERMQVTIALTDANFAAGDDVEFTLFRDGTDAGDTMAAAAILVDAEFEYTAS